MTNEHNPNIGGNRNPISTKHLKKKNFYFSNAYINQNVEINLQSKDIQNIHFVI